MCTYVRQGKLSLEERQDTVEGRTSWCQGQDVDQKTGEWDWYYSCIRYGIYYGVWTSVASWLTTNWLWSTCRILTVVWETRITYRTTTVWSDEANFHLDRTIRWYHCRIWHKEKLAGITSNRRIRFLQFLEIRILSFSVPVDWIAWEIFGHPIYWFSKFNRKIERKSVKFWVRCWKYLKIAEFADTTCRRNTGEIHSMNL